MGRPRCRGDRGDRGNAVGALPEAIAALSQTLPAGPSPEIFRRAKFDRPEAVRPAGQAAGSGGGPGGFRAAAGPAEYRSLIPPQTPALWQLLFRVLSPLPADCASASTGSPASPALGKPHLPRKARPLTTPSTCSRKPRPRLAQPSRLATPPRALARSTQTLWLGPPLRALAPPTPPARAKPRPHHKPSPR